MDSTEPVHWLQSPKCMYRRPSPAPSAPNLPHCRSRHTAETRHVYQAVARVEARSFPPLAVWLLQAAINKLAEEDTVAAKAGFRLPAPSRSTIRNEFEVTSHHRNAHQQAVAVHLGRRRCIRGRWAQVWLKPGSGSACAGGNCSRWSTADEIESSSMSARSMPNPSRTTMRSTAMSSASAGMV